MNFLIISLKTVSGNFLNKSTMNDALANLQVYIITVIIQMGQTNANQNISSGDFSLVRQVPNGAIVKENNGRLHFVKEYTFTNQQAYQQAFVNFSKKLPEKHEHILYLERTNTKLENTFCSTFFKISLLYEYLDHTLEKEIQKRVHERKVFDEKQVWSVLCSCTLAVSEMIRFQGRSHAALKTKDLRLTQEGVVKILSLQMVGMEPDQDPGLQGTVKQLAITILNCILMDQISNDSQFFLQQVIDNLQSSEQMKNVLRLMMNPRIKFVELQQYLFKLVQDDTDSLNSYSHTPIVKDKAIKNNSYSKIPEQSKQDETLFNMPRDVEDNPQNKVPEQSNQDYEIPDETDPVQDSKQTTEESLRNTLRQKNTYFDSGEKPEPQLSSRNKPEFSYKKNGQNLFTDPKLLNLIHSNLEQINKRKQIANSRKLASVQSKASLEHKQSKSQLHAESRSQHYPEQNNRNHQHTNSQSHHQTMIQNNNHHTNSQSHHQTTTQNHHHQTTTQSTSIQQNTSFNNRQQAFSLNLISKQQNTIPLLQNSSVRSTSKKQNDNSMIQGIREQSRQSAKSTNSIVLPNKNVKCEELTFKSLKSITQLQGNPEDKKVVADQNRYDNIMDIKDMGFKKNKNIKLAQQIRQSKQPKQVMHHVYHNNQSFSSQQANSNNSSFNYNTLFQHSIQSENNVIPLSNSLSQTSKSHHKNNIMYSMNQSKEEFQYVTQTYLRGKYEGTKLNNMRHGTGVFYYIEGGKYIGEWKENKMNGKGVLYYPDNSIAYDGEWKDDQLSGFGTLYNEEVTELKGAFDYKTWRDLDLYFVKYEGQFKEDSKNGKGKLFLSNGQIFDGHFKQDMVWGQGMLLRQDGSKMRGIWRQNKLLKLL